MRPAFSVIFLTTLCGAAQGLFLALFATDLFGPNDSDIDEAALFAGGSLICVGLSALGLVASFFHLGRPEKAWRSAAMWRTSWLSREVIALPVFMSLVALYGWLHWRGSNSTFWVGVLATMACITLFICTAMIYACLKFLQEWAHPLTLVNYIVLGCASGFTLAMILATFTAPDLVFPYALAALLATLIGFVTRGAALIRNARLRPKSTLQSAIGIKHPRIVQTAQGFMGSSFNTREFFHGRTREVVRAVKWGFLAAAFVVPLGLILIGIFRGSFYALAAAGVIQYLGLLAERWYFFAEAKHPQNLYYQAMS